MAGRATFAGLSGVMSDIKSLKTETNVGVSGDDTSAIGGEGRRGGDATGALSDPTYTRIDAEVVAKGMNGNATGGNMGYNSGFGRTFSGASKRPQD